MHTVVYIAFPGADLTETVECLRVAGLHPVVLDDPDPDFALVHAAARSIRIRVAVPKDEIAAAVAALRASERSPERARSLARSFERGVLRYVLVAGSIVGLGILANEIEPDFPWHVPVLVILGAWTVFLWIRAHHRAAEDTESP